MRLLPFLINTWFNKLEIFFILRLNDIKKLLEYERKFNIGVVDLVETQSH
jgi:hypothetical protein